MKFSKHTDMCIHGQPPSMCERCRRTLEEAAPDLLEACENALEWFAAFRHGDIFFEEQTASELYYKLDAVTKKARGEE